MNNHSKRPSLAKTSASIDNAPRNPEAVALGIRWAAMHPEAAPQIDRAVALVSVDAVVAPSANVFLVMGDRQVTYIVRVDGDQASCGCPDHLYRGRRCKHIFAAALFAQLATRRDGAGARVFGVRAIALAGGAR